MLKLAAATQKLSLTKPLSAEQKEQSFSPTRQHQENSEYSPQSSNSSSTSSRNSRSPTSRLPPSSAIASSYPGYEANSAMDTIFEEDGSQGSKTSIGNDSDSSDMTQSSTMTGTFAPRSSARSENGNNALSNEGDNRKKIVDNHTNSEESVSSFNHSHSHSDEVGSSIHPLQSPVRISQRSRRRGTTLSTEDLAAVTNQFQSDQNLLRRQNLSSKSPNSISQRSSSSLSHSRSKTLPISQSVLNLRSREDAGEMTKSDRKPLSRTTSASGLNHIPEGETNDNEIEWLEYSASVVKSRRRSNEKVETGLNKRPKVQSKFPDHIQRMLTEHLQKKMSSPRPQSPLVMHQLVSPHRSHSLRSNTSRLAHVEPSPVATKDVSTPKRKLAYSRSISEPATKNKASSQLKDNSSSSPVSMRKTAILPEKDTPPVSRLVMFIINTACSSERANACTSSYLYMF